MEQVNELCSIREAKTAQVVAIIEQLAEAYKELETATNGLQKATHHHGVKKQGAVDIYSDPIHGLDNLRPRVKELIKFKLFAEGYGATGATIDLVKTTANENAIALKLEATNG